MGNGPVEAERRRLAALVGDREHASLLLRSKIGDEKLLGVGSMLLGPLGFVDGVNTIYTNLDRMSDAEMTDWATRCWANTVAHLCEDDGDVRAAVITHRSVLPNDSVALDMIVSKVVAAFRFFVWAVAGPTKPLTAENCCSIKIIVLSDAILLENIAATRDGAPGGWGLLDKTIAALKDLAAANDTGRIKAIATNERVYRAFLRRGFRDRPEVEGLVRHVENYAKPVELVLG